MESVLKIYKKRTSEKDYIGMVYAICVALLPVLSMYASGIPGFSVGDIVLIVWFLYSLLPQADKNIYSVNINPLLIGMGCIVGFTSISLLLQGEGYYESIIRIIRYFFYIFCVLFVSKKLLNFSDLKKWVKIVCLIGVGYIVLQYILFYGFDYILVGFWRKLELYTPEYNRDYSEYYWMYRPTSFFLEPAHYARYSAIGLALFLYGEKNTVKDILCACLITVGILLSTSGQGYGLLVLLWGIYFIKWIVKKSSYKETMIKGIIILCGIIILPFILQIPVIEKTIERILSGGLTDGNSAIGARLGGLYKYLELDFIYQIIGKGFGQIPEGSWLSSAVYWLYGGGLIVFTIYFYFLMVSIFELKGVQKIVLLLFSVLFITDDSFYSYMCVIFLSLCLLKPKKETKKEEENI